MRLPGQNAVALLGLLVTALCGLAQELPFRRFGTNLYDFGPVLASKTNISPYILSGKFLSAASGPMTILRSVPHRYDLNLSVHPWQLSAQDQLHWRHASQLARREVSSGEFVALSKEVRRFLVPKAEVVELLGYPQSCVPGTLLRVAALPVAVPAGQSARYAYGEPLRPPITNFSVVYQVYPDRIIRQDFTNQVREKPAFVQTICTNPPALIPGADLGKADDHFKALYGPPKTETRAAAYDFSLPDYGSMLRVTRPMIVQQYQKDRLGTTVICAEDSRRAIWVRYLPLDRWTDGQLKAALAAYGSEWKRVQANSPNLLAPSLAPTTWVSANGTLAYKTLGNELVLYAPQLHADLRRQAGELERQKKAVPKF